MTKNCCFEYFRKFVMTDVYRLKIRLSVPDHISDIFASDIGFIVATGTSNKEKSPDYVSQ